MSRALIADKNLLVSAVVPRAKKAAAIKGWRTREEEGYEAAARADAAAARPAERRARLETKIVDDEGRRRRSSIRSRNLLFLSFLRALARLRQQNGSFALCYI